MKILVFSDTHTRLGPMLKAVREIEPDLILHLGDHDQDTQTLAREFSHIPLRVVRGNCDFGAKTPLLENFRFADKRIIMTHGHRYNVKWDYTAVIEMGQASGADFLLFGHTHVAHYEKVGEMHVLNPGSAGAGHQKSCGLIQLTDGGILCSHLPL